jgi:hypothetical protein
MSKNQYWIMTEKELRPDFTLTDKLIKKAKKEIDGHTTT